MAEVPVFQHLPGVARQELPVHGGRGGEAEDAEVRVPLSHTDVLGREMSHTAHGLPLGLSLTVAVSDEFLTDLPALLRRQVAPGSVDGPGLEDGSLGNISGDGRDEVSGDTASSRTLSEQCYFLPVTTETLDVVLDPLE